MSEAETATIGTHVWGTGVVVASCSPVHRRGKMSGRSCADPHYFLFCLQLCIGSLTPNLNPDRIAERFLVDLFLSMHNKSMYGAASCTCITHFRYPPPCVHLIRGEIYHMLINYGKGADDLEAGVDGSSGLELPSELLMKVKSGGLQRMEEDARQLQEAEELAKAEDALEEATRARRAPKVGDIPRRCVLRDCGKHSFHLVFMKMALC